MKPILLSILLLLGLGFTMPALTGCNTPAKVVAYKTLASVQAASVTALEVYRQEYLAGKITPEKRQQVLRLYTQYQSAYLLALDAAQFDKNAAAPANVSALLVELVDLINTFK